MAMRMRITFLIALLLFSSIKAGASDLAFSGQDLLTSKTLTYGKDLKKPLVVVFLSAACPCSDSHVQELKSLAKDFAQFDFVAIHSNVDEPVDRAKIYFSKVALPFSVLQDENAKLANQFGAFKTPHSFVIKANGEIIFRGGVSSSHQFELAEHKYLREALSDVAANRAVRTPEARTLGCVISRGGKNVW